jgi:hypothetical protein
VNNRKNIEKSHLHLMSFKRRAKKREEREHGTPSRGIFSRNKWRTTKGSIAAA